MNITLRRLVNSGYLPPHQASSILSAITGHHYGDLDMPIPLWVALAAGIHVWLSNSINTPLQVMAAVSMMSDQLIRHADTLTLARPEDPLPLFCVLMDERGLITWTELAQRKLTRYELHKEYWLNAASRAMIVTLPAKTTHMLNVNMLYSELGSLQERGQVKEDKDASTTSERDVIQDPPDSGGSADVRNDSVGVVD